MFGVVVNIILFLLVDIPLALLMAITRAIARRPIVIQCSKLLLEQLTNVIVHVLSNDRVRHATAPVIAQGMHVFLYTGERAAQARKQGEEFPSLLGAFLQGLMKGSKQQQEEEEEQDKQQQQEDKQPKQQHQFVWFQKNHVWPPHRPQGEEADAAECKHDDSD